MRASVRLTLACLLCVLLFGVAAASAQESVSEAAYWALVARTRDAVAAGEALADLAGEWEQLTVVTLDDGREIAVDARYLASLLRDETADRQRLVALLETLQSAEAEFTPPPANPAAAEVLARTLDRSEFDYGPQPPSLRDIIIQRILEALFGSNGTTALAQVFLQAWPIFAVLIVGSAVIYILRSLSFQFASSVNEAAGDPYVPDLTPSAAISRAEERSQAGDYRDAVRYLYLAVLLDLDERGVLDYDRTRTNREVVRAIRSAPDVANELQTIVDVFDDVWYGFHSLSQADYRDYERRVANLRARRAPVVQLEGA